MFVKVFEEETKKELDKNEDFEYLCDEKDAKGAFKCWVFLCHNDDIAKTFAADNAKVQYSNVLNF